MILARVYRMLAEAESEFYSVAGAERLAERLPEFTEGRALVAVAGEVRTTAAWERVVRR